MVASREERRVNTVDRNGTTLKQAESFKYLGPALNNKGRPDDPVKARVIAAWNKWRQMIGVLGDRRMPRKLKVKICKTVVRPVLMYGSEVWTIRKS